MPDAPMTLTEIANLIGAVEARDSHAIYQQLRGLQNVGVFIAHDRNGTRGAARFTLTEAVRARVLTAFLDIGMGRNDVVAINAALNAANLEPGAGVRPATRLGLFLEDEAGSEWILNVDIYRDGSGDFDLHPTFARANEFTADLDEAVQLTHKLKGLRRQSRVTIYVSELCAPLLKVARDA